MTAPFTIPIRVQYKECVICPSKPCRRTRVGTLEVCAYGIAFYNTGSEILTNRERVTTRDIAANLRHELHRVLMYIVSQADEIEPNLSTRRINLASPSSRIVGATVILDKFIEMVSGVYDFHPDRGCSTSGTAAQISLYDTVRRLVDTYSLIKNVRRASRLDIAIDIPRDLAVVTMASPVENLIAVFTDNIWKYSLPDTRVVIRSKPKSATLVDLEFTNIGKPLPLGSPIFEKGYQAYPNSEGFGFGLYWAKVLADHYNDAQRRIDSPMSIQYGQELIDAERTKHIFTIENLAVQDKQ